MTSFYTCTMLPFVKLKLSTTLGQLYLRKRKQETILCFSLASEDMARCIVQLHYITGCDANSNFYGKGKSLASDKVTRSVVAQQTLLKRENSLDIDQDMIDKLLKFTCNVIYGDNKSSADKWKAMKKKSFL